MGPLAAKSNTLFKPFCSSTPSNSMIKPAILKFKVGDDVEVCCNEEGFWGSYWEATVVARLVRDNEYLVEYKTLLEDDLSGALREIVPARDVRPVPPSPSSARLFRCGDRVDAFDRDGWWVGRVTRMDHDHEGLKCYVYFEMFKVEVAYDACRIRSHQYWFKGKWVVL